MYEERAHKLGEKPRTEDVIISENISFKDLLLSRETLKGLEASGFTKPSPIQRKAIPFGRCGFDLIVQAKSGTGKTCVFTVIALEMINIKSDQLQVLILSPTREISVQIKDVIQSIGQGFNGLKTKAFIGGLPLESDKKNLEKCHIAVGAPGRVKHLITEGLMKCNAVRLLVLDEADKLMEDSFRNDISFIYLKLPKEKQIIATSATFPPALNEFFIRYMVNPTTVNLEEDVFLKGIRQFASVVPAYLHLLPQMECKIAEVIRILSKVQFKQCLIFANYQSRVESLCSKLKDKGWPCVHISGSQSQTTRLKSLSSLKEFRCRIFVSTDLTSRGIDAENVNLVINFDLPYNGPTYLHRIGRAGRYGSYGLAISIVQDGSECQEFQKMLYEVGGENFKVSVFPKDPKFDIWTAKNDAFETLKGMKGEYKFTTSNFEDKKKILNGEVNDNFEKHKKESNELKKEILCSFTDLEISNNLQLRDYRELLNSSNDYMSTTKLNCNSLSDCAPCTLEIPPSIGDKLFSIEQKNWEKFKDELEKQNNFSKNNSASSTSSESYSQDSETENEITNEYEKDKISNDDKINNELAEKWYSKFYSQFRTIKQYVNYVKDFQYENSNFNYL